MGVGWFETLGAIRWGLLVQMASTFFAAVAAGAAAYAALATRSELRDQRLVREFNALIEIHDRVQMLLQAAAAPESDRDSTEFDLRRARLRSALHSTTFVLPKCIVLSKDTPSHVREEGFAATIEVEAALEKKGHELNPSAGPINWAVFGDRSDPRQGRRAEPESRASGYGSSDWDSGTGSDNWGSGSGSSDWGGSSGDDETGKSSTGWGDEAAAGWGDEDAPTDSSTSPEDPDAPAARA
jgi:uncharacterized membrane protein YgcG